MLSFNFFFLIRIIHFENIVPFKFFLVKTNLLENLRYTFMNRFATWIRKVKDGILMFVQQWQGKWIALERIWGILLILCIIKIILIVTKIVTSCINYCRFFIVKEMCLKLDEDVKITIIGINFIHQTPYVYIN